MAMDLRGAGGYLRCSATDFVQMLMLARDYGWEPRGTEAPEWQVSRPDGTTEAVPMHDHWDGGYASNDHQLVTDGDAAGIADALDLALPDVASSLPKTDAGFSVRLPRESEETTPLEWWSGNGRAVREFAAYCRAGGFVVGQGRVRFWRNVEGQPRMLPRKD